MTLSLTLVELTEHVRDWKPADLRVDRERRLVRNVALTAVESRNGYRYTEEALRQALALYEGKPVFLDHAANVARPYDRSTRDLVGSIVNPRFEDGRVRGDIRVLDTDAGRTFLGLVESDSPAVGMSHVVLAERSSDSLTVERIHDVISVDAVVFPATAATFRETAAKPEPAGSPVPSVEQSAASPSVALAAEAAGDDAAATAEPPTAEPSAGKNADALLTDACRDAAAELAGGRDRLMAERDELARDVETLRQELERLRRERDREQDEQEINRMLTESNLPPAVITEVFRRQLRTESDPAARQALVTDRQRLVRRLTTPTPHSRERDADGPAGVSDERFVTAIRRRA